MLPQLIGSYLLGHEPVGDFPTNEVENMQLQDIEQLYTLVDTYVYEAIEKYTQTMNELTESKSSFKKQTSIQKTPHHLLLHAFTHEFHHKGQITAMLHLMGHTPNNTNMVLFESISNK